MGTEIKPDQPRRVVDATKGWRSQFFECKEKPAAEGRSELWPRPQHGIQIKEVRDGHNRAGRK